MHETDSKEFTISETDITFESIYEKPYFPVDIPEVKEANMLLIPNTDLREGTRITFPETTNEFYEYLKDNADDSFKPDIAVSDDDFKKFNMHSALVPIATIVCTTFVLPIVLNLVSCFLYDLAKQYLRKREELSADVSICVQETKKKKSIKLHYKGPVSGIKDAMSEGAMEAFKDMYIRSENGIELIQDKQEREDLPEAD